MTVVDALREAIRAEDAAIFTYGVMTAFTRSDVRGRVAADIAARLHVSPLTVKTHVSHILAKLGVADRAAAVKAARGRPRSRAKPARK